MPPKLVLPPLDTLLAVRMGPVCMHVMDSQVSCHELVMMMMSYYSCALFVHFLQVSYICSQ